MPSYCEYKHPEPRWPETLRNEYFRQSEQDCREHGTAASPSAPAWAAAFSQGRLCPEDNPLVVSAAGMKQRRDPGCAGAGGKRWAPAAAARANQHRLPEIAPK